MSKLFEWFNKMINFRNDRTEGDLMNANEPLRFSNVAPTIELISIKSSTPFTRMKKICWDLFCFKIFSNLLCYFFFAIKHENVVLKNTYSFKILSLSTTIFMITIAFRIIGTTLKPESLYQKVVIASFLYRSDSEILGPITKPFNPCWSIEITLYIFLYCYLKKQQ